jgi:hypothetical protein
MRIGDPNGSAALGGALAVNGPLDSSHRASTQSP